MPARADDVAATSADVPMRSARLLAASCASCHGLDGYATDGMPSLAGLPRERMVEAMQAFRTGQQPATVMHQLARGFSDEQVGLLADHFARLEVAR